MQCDVNRISLRNFKVTLLKLSEEIDMLMPKLLTLGKKSLNVRFRRCDGRNYWI